jgi:hypothetical protein
MLQYISTHYLHYQKLKFSTLLPIVKQRVSLTEGFFMIKLLSKLILLSFAIASLTGCSSFLNNLQNNMQSLQNNGAIGNYGVYDQQGNLIDRSQSSDGIPYAIGHYLQEMKIARNTQVNEQRQDVQ